MAESANNLPGLSERQAEVLRRVRREGYVSIDELAGVFGVTPQTMRRDVNAMCEAGLLRRYHGGAALPSSAENADYSFRQVHRLEEKRRIARLVARHVPDQSSLFINIGTTTEEVSRALVADHRGLRVITNNLNVAAIMSASEHCEVLVAGGVVRRRDRGITGETTIDFIGQFNADFAIIGISGIGVDGALLDFDYHEVRVSRAIMKNARSVFLVADHTKFARHALVRLGHVSALDALFTDRDPPPPLRRVLDEAGVAVHVADEGAY